MSAFTVDLTNCEREPIHILGQIQAHGYLIAIEPESCVVVHASENIQALLGISAASLLGQPLDHLLPQTKLAGQPIEELLHTGRQQQSWESVNPYRMVVNKGSLNLIIHEHNGLILLEWEPAGTDFTTQLNQRLISQALNEVQSSRTLPELLQNTAERIKTIIGYDRVMVYRFSPDWHGHVIAEAKDDSLEPFLGLHYPASDIPRQARELYKTNLVRLIADVNSTPSRLLSQVGQPLDKPLDLTHSVLRAVSPVHIQYLKNMGVQASMSISLLHQGELWGLISCHNNTPRFVDYPARQAAKFVGQLLSAALEFRKDSEDKANLIAYNQCVQQLNEQLLLTDDVPKALMKSECTVLSVNSATGAALVFDDKVYRLGKTPDETDIRDLVDWISTVEMPNVLETSHLASMYPAAKPYREVASGLMAIAVSREMKEYLLWFKPEQVQEVTWAGNPEKPVTVDEDGQQRLSPRKSFAAWTEVVRNTSTHWTEAEVSVAAKLREDVLQVLAKQANAIRLLNQRLQLAYEELDAFSYTVSHDLRTPLSSIRCYSEILLEEHGKAFDEDAHALFAKIIDSTERMRALIRHILYYSRMGRTDLKTELVDMKQLLESIREETLVNEKGRSLSIEIGDTPPVQADRTMALQLFTNLISNSAKYSRATPNAFVRVNGQQTGKEVVYTVEDNGIGFDMKHANKMFDLFKRLENARGYEGSGVGLAIVKRIVNRHDGRIAFDSAPNRGTKFTITFPEDPTE